MRHDCTGIVTSYMGLMMVTVRWHDGTLATLVVGMQSCHRAPSCRRYLVWPVVAVLSENHLVRKLSCPQVVLSGSWLSANYLFTTPPITLTHNPMRNSTSIANRSAELAEFFQTQFCMRINIVMHTNETWVSSNHITS